MIDVESLIRTRRNTAYGTNPALSRELFLIPFVCDSKFSQKFPIAFAKTAEGKTLDGAEILGRNKILMA
jgi:hypothetical protein